MARILSRRADGAPQEAPTVDAASVDAPTTVQEAAGEQPTVVAEAVPAAENGAAAPETAAPDAAAAPEAAAPEAPPTDVASPEASGLPAGAERVPDGTPSFLSRGKLRRRLRYLRRVRELAFRDLGGLVFDLDRFGREKPELVEMKLAGLRSIDGELRALEIALGDARDVEELEEPGIAACAHCGALHGSEDKFCPACGRSVDEPVEVAPAAEDPPSEDPPAADQPSA